MNVSLWLDKEYSEKCEVCGDKKEIRALGSSGLKVACSDYNCENYPMESMLLPKYEYTPVRYELPNGDEFRYQCPECDSYDIDRTPYNDGCGYVDVKLECNDCSASTWE